ncbi:stalk domain-containing protein [Cohnella sp.]|uniref:stalk domain-containing protein n=1 Tax=Cohnella sp. TaxID=1883426 RepID=UPI0037048180
MLHKGKGFVMLLLTVVLLAVSAIPAYADEAPGKTEIRLKVGSKQMKINGESVSIQPPYQESGTVMVPLSVFTNKKGFGAKVQLTNNKIIKLTYGTHTIVVTLGSKDATIDGKKTTLPVAPASKQGVAMVPLSIIAKSFEATLAKDAATQELVLKFVSVNDKSAGGKNIDTDAGKSKIGDSYYGWSMNYPTGLTMSSQTQDGDIVVFEDVKKEYYLAVIVEEAKDKLTMEETRNTIYGYFDEGEKVVDKKTVGSGAAAYERVTTKNKGGFFFEYRGIQANDSLYIVIFGKKAKTAQELAKSTGLLDSFRTAFNRSDVSVKDLTQIVNGLKTFADEDYGLSVKLPKEWKTDTEASIPWFYLEDSGYLYLDVTSLVPGDTLDEWIKRKQARFEQTFATASRKEPEIKNVVWNGVSAKLMKLAYSWDTEKWWEEYEIFAIEGEYRYYTELAYPKDSPAAQSNLLDNVLRSMKADFATVESNFGELADELDNIDRSAVVTRTSEKYGYRITLPQYWTGDKKSLEETEMEYTTTGVGAGVNYWEDESVTFSELTSTIDDYYKELSGKNSKIKIIENTTVQFAGFTAKKVVFEDKTNNKDSTPYRITNYFVLKGDKVYNVWGFYYLANASDFNVKNMEAALSTFAFTR